MFVQEFYELFFSSGTGHSMMVLALVIGIGLLLGKIRFKGISFGSVWILLVGILAGALGIKASPLFLHFTKELGLVLFVFAIGLQVGPSFFHSFKGQGLRLNLLAMLLILLTVGCTLALFTLSDQDLPSLVGVMTGATSSTPGLGTAQQAFYEATEGTFLAEVEKPAMSAAIANAFAVAYPVGILMLTLVLIGFRYLFKVNLKKEGAFHKEEETVIEVIAEVVNPAIFGKTLNEVLGKFQGNYIPSTFCRGKQLLPVADNPLLEKGDLITLEVRESDRRMVQLLFGKEVEKKAAETLSEAAGALVSRRLTVTKPSITGKRLSDLDILGRYGVTVTRVSRSGVNLVARPDLYLQMGDVIKVVGEEKTIEEVAHLVGNSSVSLEKPNLVPIFIGIALGLILGTLPLKVPGMMHTMCLGLAGGPLIIAILLGHFGPKWKIATYTTSSANRMLREMGLTLLLGSIGLGAGASFTQTFDPAWIGYAAILCAVPAIITGLVARYALKMNFFQICGLLIGANTNSAVLPFVDEAFGSDRATVSFATVYPMALFLQVLVAELLVLLSFVL